MQELLRLLLVVLRQVAGVDALGEVPSAMTALAADDRDLALAQQEVEHDRHLVGSRPAVRCATDLCGVGDVCGQQRTLRAESREHVVAESRVGVEPLARALALRPAPHRREHQRQQAHRPERTVELEQQPIDLDRLDELTALVRPPDPRPQHGLLAGRDRGGGVDLDVPELLGDLDDVARALGVEQLRAHREAASLVACERVGHRSRVAAAR